MDGSLPRIVRFIETVESGACPHCGSAGRFVHRFKVADGRVLGAMSGCVKLFPVSRVAREEQRLRKKAEDYADRGWKLNKADSEAMGALESFFSGVGTEASALSLVDAAKRSNVLRARTRRAR